jgi:hypothetical protein
VEAIYGSFFRRVQFAIMGAKATTAPKARLAAEGISLAQAFKDKYLVLLGYLLQLKDIPGGASHLLIEDFNVRKLYDRILAEGLDPVLDDVFSRAHRNSSAMVPAEIAKLLGLFSFFLPSSFTLAFYFC